MENSFHAILILLAMSVIAVAIFRRWHLPPILGYLTVGLLLDHTVFGFLSNSDQMHHLAEFGVVFLLFTVGLEFSLPQLFAMKTTVLGLGGLQVLICSIIAAAITLLAGESYSTAFIVGGIIAMSSTAIVVKLMTEQLEIHSRHGRSAMAILIFQDLAVIPFLIIMPLMHGNNDQNLLYLLTSAFAKGAIAFLVMLALGRWALRPLFHMIANARSTELFMMTVLLIALTAAWSTHLANLSLAFGAFLAGAMLGETEFRHQIEAYIRPFRDILLGFFFITVGMLLNFNVLIQTWDLVILILLGLIIIKAIIIFLLSRLFKLETGVAMRTAIVLAQGGEFGFAIISLALTDKLLSNSVGQPLLAAIVLSMVIAPFLIRHNGAITKKLCKRSYLGNRQEQQSKIAERTEYMQNHVVICGYGRVGQNIAKFLELESIPYIALDMDPDVINEASSVNDNIFYGDSTQADILKATHVDRARILVVAFDDINATYKVLAHTRDIHANIPILVRTRDALHLDKLMATGASEVVPEKLEASLVLVSHLLTLLDVKPEDIKKKIKAARSNQYLLLRRVFQGFNTEIMDAQSSQRKHVHTVSLDKNAYAIGKTLQQLELEKDQIIVTAIKRGQEKQIEPGPDMVLYENDVLELFGYQKDIEHAEAKLLKG